MQQIDNQRTIKIMKYIDRVGGNLHPPSLQVALTDKCFNQCGFCGHWLRKDHYEIDLSKWLRYLHWASENGLESVCYIGGDFLAYRNCNEVMWRHTVLKMPFGLVTTGYVPNFVDLDMLKKARWVRCSLDAISSDVYDACRGGVKVEKVCDSIDKMLSKGTNVELFCALHNKNIVDVNNLINYALSINVNLYFNKAEDGTCENDQYDDSLFKHRKKEFDDKGLVLGWDFNQYNNKSYLFNKCNAVYYQLYVASDGSYYPCCHLAGDTKEQSFIEPIGTIYDDFSVISERLRQFSNLDSNQRPDQCKNCGERFQTINQTVEQYSKLHQKNFF